MKKIIFALMLICVTSIITFNLSLTSSNEDISLICLANIEALAQHESGLGIITPTRSCYRTISTKGDGNLTHQTFCGSCDAQLCRTWSNPYDCSHNKPS